MLLTNCIQGRVCMKSNILIVEDHELTRFGLKTAFENCSYADEIFEAERSEEHTSELQSR